jgi:hypothetical protein
VPPARKVAGSRMKRTARQKNAAVPREVVRDGRGASGRRHLVRILGASGIPFGPRGRGPARAAMKELDGGRSRRPPEGSIRSPRCARPQALPRVRIVPPDDTCLVTSHRSRPFGRAASSPHARERKGNRGARELGWRGRSGRTGATSRIQGGCGDRSVEKPAGRASTDGVVASARERPLRRQAHGRRGSRRSLRCGAAEDALRPPRFDSPGGRVLQRAP